MEVEKEAEKVLLWKNNGENADPYGLGVSFHNKGFEENSLVVSLLLPHYVHTSRVSVIGAASGAAGMEDEKIAKDSKHSRQPVLLAEKMLRKAYTCFLKASTYIENVADTEMWLKVASVYRILGDVEGALTILSRLVQDHPNFRLVKEVILMCAVM